MGGGRFDVQADVRELRGSSLEDLLVAARNNASLATQEFNKAVSDAADELIQKEKMLVGPAMDQARAEVSLTDVGTRERQGQVQLQEANRALTLHNSRFELATNQVIKEQQSLKLRIGMNAIFREDIILQEKLLQLGQMTDAERKEKLPLLEKEAKEQARLERQLENQLMLGNSIKNNMEGAFESIITGTASAKEAFASMARSILADIAKMIAKQLVFNALQGTQLGSFLGMKDGGITPKLSYGGGGYSPRRNYSTGGVARGPQSGYAATLHGNEAIVPLPNSRSIPVEFPQGGPGGNNNVTVNVTMNNDGTATSGVQGDTSMSTLGNAIAKAVQIELQNQKRAGGILSPYGAA